jgi:hypothetical protein
MADDDPLNAEEKTLDRVVGYIALTPWIVVVAFALLAVAYAVAFASNGLSKAPESWGQFGDYIGGMLNPLVAVFALVALSTSVKLQKKELTATREELRASKQAAQEQARTSEQQRREQRFFDLLNLYHLTVATVEADGKMGKIAFRHWTSEHAVKYSFIYEFLNFGFESHRRYWRPPTDRAEALRQLADKSITQVDETQLRQQWAHFSPVLDHYFRTVFAILREAQPTLGTDHFRYVKLFRAQLSRDELTLLTFNLLFDEEGAKMQNLVAEYGLLKHLPPGPLRTIAAERLDPKSFGQKWASVN